MNIGRKIDKEEFDNLQTLEHKIKFCLRYAVLAPSTHNTQPWLFKIEGNKVKIYFDPKLKLPQADPSNRNLYISVGKCLENLLIASKYFGVFDSLAYKIGEEENLVAEVVFKEAGEKRLDFEHLINTIPNRVNSRGVFLDKKIPDEVLAELKKLFTEKYEQEGLELNIITEKEKIKRLAELTEQGMHIAHASPDFRREMSGWLQNSLSTKKEGMPGYSLRMPFLLSFIIPTLVKKRNLGGLLGKLNYKSIVTAPCFFLFSSKNNEPLIWVKMGLAIERMSLELQSRGIKTSVYIASIEMGELYKEVQKMINMDSIPQFIFCAGYMNFNQQVTPKHSVEEKLIN